MGILNVTPDSFSDGGRFLEPGAALEHARRLAEAGADILDVGGESTRPGSTPISAEEEAARVVPIIREVVRERLFESVSVDTSKARVAREALEAGASIINDVTALRGDLEMLPLIAGTNARVILMHMKGAPLYMQIDPHYDDVAREIKEFLAERARAAIEAGISPERIIVDPGIGFGKTAAHNLELIRRAGELKGLGYPVLVGPSRKAFIGRVTGVTDPAQRDLATAVCVGLLVAQGIDMVRVHEPESARQAALLAEAVMKGMS